MLSLLYTFFNDFFNFFIHWILLLNILQLWEELIYFGFGLIDPSDEFLEFIGELIEALEPSKKFSKIIVLVYL